ncbi:MAG: APC family permease [Chloroflexota bacterium]|nr:MAG: hypothetical protein DLM70_14320 [Chloroflexota bacterium]
MAQLSSRQGEQPRLGEQNLTVIHAVGQSLAIGPIFSAGIISGLVASAAGYSTPLSVLLGSIGALALGYVIALYAQRFAGAGAMYEYLARATAPAIGIFGAGLYFLGSLFLGAGGIYIALGYVSNNFFVNHLSWNPPWWIGSFIALAIVFALNHFGVRLAIRGILVLAFLSFIPFVVTSIVIIAKGGFSGNDLTTFGTHYSSWNAVFNGVLFAVTLFIGFEAAASIAEECREPRRAIPIAVLTAIALCAVFYILVNYAATIGYGQKGIGSWAASTSPIADLGNKYVGKWMGFLIDLAIIFDMMSLSLAIMVSTARGFFALGRDGFLPRWTTALSPAGTPLGGNVIVAAWSLVLIVWAIIQSWGKSSPLPSEVQTFFVTTAVGSYLVELIYIFLALGALWILWSSGRRRLQDFWAYLVVLAGLATPILAFKGSLSPFPVYPNNLGVWIAVAALVIAALWTIVIMMTRPERVSQAALYAVGEDAALPIRGMELAPDAPLE